jgi:hypothetical protein
MPSKAKISQYGYTQRAKRAKHHRCTRCGKRPRPSSVYCRACADYCGKRGHMRYRRAARYRRCVICGIRKAAANRCRCTTCATKYNARQRRNYAQLWRQVLAGYGSKCACVGCSEMNPKFLTIDHVANDGAIDRQKNGGSMWALLRRVIKQHFPARYQLLCYNCNLGKHRNGGTCPHNERHIGGGRHRRNRSAASRAI